MTEISIVIPAYNAEATIGATLRSLAALDFAVARFEVIVVDDGSTDNTNAIIAEFQKNAAIAFRHVRRSRAKTSGAAVARNEGVALAQGRIIAFTDADCTVDRDWLTSIRQAIIEEGFAIVGGETLCDQLVVFPWKMSPAGQRGITANLAYDRERCGPVAFDASFTGLYGEDTDFITRIAKAGHALRFVPSMRVGHPVRSMGMREIARRCMYRKNDVLLYKRYGAVIQESTSRFFRPSIFGRMSIASLCCLAVAVWFLAALAGAAPVAPLLIFGTLAALAFVAFLYRKCIIYVPAGAQKRLGIIDRLRTLVYVLAYLPCFLISRIIGSLEFHYFLL